MPTNPSREEVRVQRLTDNQLAQLAHDVASSTLAVDTGHIERALMELIERRADDLSDGDAQTLADAQLFFFIARDTAGKADSPKGVETAERILALLTRLERKP